MTPDDVKRELERIASAAARGEDEEAHLLEDGLWHRLLSAIADGVCADPEACARLALKSSEIEFSRWRS